MKSTKPKLQTGPVMSRPVKLFPEAVPAGVRYEYADDMVVISAASSLDTALIRDDSTSLFGSSVKILSGAWTQFKDRTVMIQTDANTYQYQGKSGAWTLSMEGIILSDSSQTFRLGQMFRKLLTEHGGFEMKALTTQDMRKWWTYIPDAIVEPVFIIETVDQKFRFVVTINKVDRTIETIDELNAHLDFK